MRHQIRDSYHASVWLTGEAIAFLDSQFPDDEIEIAIAKLIDRSMRQAKRRSCSDRPTPPRGEVKQTIFELKPAPKVEPHQNSINRLQELCQRADEPLPEYTFEECREGFSCAVVVLGIQTIGLGKSKRLAKKDAATAAIAALGS